MTAHLTGLAGISRSTLREQAFAALHTAITSGDLRPGQRLGEVELATRFGVSRGTVREALRALQQSGLVAVDDRGQSSVRVLTNRQIRELFHVRASLEGLAAVEIARCADRAELLRQLREALPPESTAGMTEGESLHRDLAFHEKLCALSGNSVLLTLWQHLKDMISMVIIAGNDKAVPQLMTRGHHEPIIQAIESGRSARITAAVSAHMERAAQLWAPDEQELPREG